MTKRSSAFEDKYSAPQRKSWLRLWLITTLVKDISTHEMQSAIRYKLLVSKLLILVLPLAVNHYGSGKISDICTRREWSSAQWNCRQCVKECRYKALTDPAVRSVVLTYLGRCCAPFPVSSFNCRLGCAWNIDEGDGEDSSIAPLGVATKGQLARNPVRRCLHFGAAAAAADAAIKDRAIRTEMRHFRHWPTIRWIAHAATLSWPQDRYFSDRAPCGHREGRHSLQ